MKKRGKLLIIGLIILISLIILCITFSIFRGIYCTKLSSGPESKILKELEEKFEVDEILGETESDIHCTGDGEPSILFSGQTNYIICMIKNYGEENESYKFNLINFVIRDKRGNYIEKDGILEIRETGHFANVPRNSTRMFKFYAINIPKKVTNYILSMEIEVELKEQKQTIILDFLIKKFLNLERIIC